eukprot:1405495-Prymnesium_polylepis.1
MGASLPTWALHTSPVLHRGFGCGAPSCGVTPPARCGVVDGGRSCAGSHLPHVAVLCDARETLEIDHVRHHAPALAVRRAARDCAPHTHSTARRAREPEAHFTHSKESASEQGAFHAQQGERE